MKKNYIKQFLIVLSILLGFNNAVAQSIGPGLSGEEIDQIHASKLNEISNRKIVPTDELTNNKVGVLYSEVLHLIDTP